MKLQKALKNISLAVRVSFYSGCMAFTFKDNVGYIARVDGQSMQPLLNPAGSTWSDFILLDKWRSNNYTYQRGDVVVLKSPRKTNREVIKRIVGLEGDVITTKDKKARTVYIPKGHCWVEGDNRNNSVDSHKYGPIPLALIVGRPLFIVWPPNRWGSVNS